jgi:hypothetical protein
MKERTKVPRESVPAAANRFPAGFPAPQNQGIWLKPMVIKYKIALEAAN